MKREIFPKGCPKKSVVLAAMRACISGEIGTSHDLIKWIQQVRFCLSKNKPSINEPFILLRIKSRKAEIITQYSLLYKSKNLKSKSLVSKSLKV